MARIILTQIWAPLLLLVLTTSASAECAWVLWLTSYQMSGRKATAEVTQPAEAFATKAECVKAIEEHQELDARRKKQPETYYRCFPDTVDPRGPKGGK